MVPWEVPDFLIENSKVLSLGVTPSHDSQTTLPKSQQFSRLPRSVALELKVDLCSQKGQSAPQDTCSAVDAALAREELGLEGMLAHKEVPRF